MEEVPRYDVLGVVPSRKEEEKSYWHKIGAAFTNKDGSINVKLDFFPSHPTTTIQLRKPKETVE